MPVLAIGKPDLDPLVLALAMNHDRPNQQLEEDVKAALIRALDLIQPRVAYEFLRVSGRGPDWITVSSGRRDNVRLTPGPRADLLDQAEQVLAGLTTIGPELEREVERLNRQGDYYGGYILDCIGIALLGEAGKVLDNLAMESAAQRGWGVGYRLAPGSLNGWEMSDQKVLATLLPLEAIEASLDENGVIWPFKSAASLIGMGPGYPRGEVRPACHLCNNREACWTKEKDFSRSGCK